MTRSELGYPGDVRFPPNSDQTADIVSGPVRANLGSGRNHSITSSARANIWLKRAHLGNRFAAIPIWCSQLRALAAGPVRVRKLLDLSSNTVVY